jgi:hypothetical protein
MLQAGKYRARAVGAALGKTGTGKEQIAVEFDLLDHQGDSITWYGLFHNEEAFEITMKGLRTAGFQGDDISDFGWIQACPEVVLVVVNEEYQGQTKAKVRFINSAGGVAMKEALDEGSAAAFAKSMKGRIAAFNRASGPKKAAPKASNGHGPDHEESPFNDDPPV